MSWRRRFFDFAYRRGSPRWDTGVTPPEVVEIVEGQDALAPGRALDLGCGTGTNIAYLARHRWEAVGVDFSRRAVEAAKLKTTGVPGVSVVEGDVTRLSSLGIEGPFDLVLDIGCFHAIPAARRQAYVEETAGVTRPGGVLMIWAFGSPDRWRLIPSLPGVSANEVEGRFGAAFDIVRIVAGREPKGSAWYTLRRATSGAQDRTAL